MERQGAESVGKPQPKRGTNREGANLVPVIARLMLVCTLQKMMFWHKERWGFEGRVRLGEGLGEGVERKCGKVHCAMSWS